MKTKKNKLLLVGITLFTICSTLASCASENSDVGTAAKPCQLVKEVAAYTDLKVTAATPNEKYSYYVNVTFTNNGDQYVPIYSFDNEYYSNNGVQVSHIYADYKCPFDHRYIAPKESFDVIADYYPYGSQENCAHTILNQSVKTCYYTSEYTGMEFSDLKIKLITEEERKEKRLYNYAYLYYKPSGKFKDGDNYHLLINFTYDGETYTVMSTDPEYELNAFGLDLEHHYYVNYLQWDDPDGHYKDYVLDESKITVNWVKCYTAWFRDKQPKQCRDVWRCYEDKTARVLTKVFTAVGIIAFFGAMIALIVIIQNKRNKAGN